MIEMAFLNFEMDLCEQILAQNEQEVSGYGVFDPEPLAVPSNATQLTNRRPTQVKELSPRTGMMATAIRLPDQKALCCWSAISPRTLSSNRRSSPSTRSRSRRPYPRVAGLRNHAR